MYAVIEMKWHQYIVKKDTDLVVDRFQDWDSLTCDKVLCVFDDNQENVNIWQPYVSWAVVEFEKVEDKKWDKIRVLKFHRKNRYEKVYGFRAHQTVLKVKDIKLNGK